MSENISTTSASDVFGPEAPAPQPPPLPTKKYGANVIKENALLIAMPLISAAILYTLSLRGGPAVASAEQLRNERQVESVMTNLSSRGGEMSKVKTQTILDNFYHEAKQRQIPLEMVRGNPFIFKAPDANGASGTNATSVQIVPAETPRPADLESAAALKAVKQLNLQSVLTGGSGRPIATISNNLLSEGQVISGWTVSKIEATQVTLKWKDQTYVLQMKE